MFKRVKNNFSTQFSFRFENQSATFFSNFFCSLSLLPPSIWRFSSRSFRRPFFFFGVSLPFFESFLLCFCEACLLARHTMPNQFDALPCLVYRYYFTVARARFCSLLFFLYLLWILWCRSAAGCTTELIAQSSFVLNARSSLFLFYTLNGGPLVGRQHATYYTFHVELYAQNNNKKRRTLHSSTPSRTMHGDG